MNYIDLKLADTPADQLLKIRHTLIDGIWKGLVFVALLGTPASVSRSTLTGWRPMYSFYVGMALLALAMYMAKRSGKNRYALAERASGVGSTE